MKFILEDGEGDNKQITICTQMGSGEIVETLNDNDIEIGFSVDNEDRFKCKNSTIRDICGIDTSGIGREEAENAEGETSEMIMNVVPRTNNVEIDDPRFDTFVMTFEYYWNRWVGIVIAVFAASIFFNLVMCIYWSGLTPMRDQKMNAMDKKIKFVVDDGDDDTEEESDGTDNDDQHV